MTRLVCLANVDPEDPFSSEQKNPRCFSSILDRQTLECLRDYYPILSSNCFDIPVESGKCNILARKLLWKKICIVIGKPEMKFESYLTFCLQKELLKNTQELADKKVRSRMTLFH